jgi:hypothetical protein
LLCGVLTAQVRVSGKKAELAAKAEARGFTGLLVADSQNLTAEIWVELALAGAATRRLQCGDVRPLLLRTRDRGRGFRCDPARS